MTEKRTTPSSRSIDELISEALKSDEKEFLDHYKHDPSLIQFISANLRGRMGWLGWGTFIMIDLILALGIYFGYQAFQSGNIQHTVLWASGTVMCYTAIGFLKLWSWIEASRRSTLYEIKRLELHLAKLAE